MSADNYYRICKHPKGGYTAVMGFMSNKMDGQEAEPTEQHPQFDTVAEAVALAERETILEYGIEYDADCWPIPPGQPNAAILKLAFWEAMNRSDNDERVHAMDAPCFHRGTEDGGDQLVDGYLPDVLWEHMAVAIAELRAAAGLGKPQ